MNRLFGSVFLLVLLGCSAISAKWMIADFYGERVALSLDHWNRTNTSPDLDILDRHLEFISQARKLSPNSARYMELEAQLRLKRLFDIPFIDFVQELNIMLDLHSSALEHRPNWPFSWANMVYVKGILREYDTGYEQALNGFMKYGAYEAAGLLRVISISARSGSWQNISEDAREQIYLATANLAELNRNMSRSVRRHLQDQQLLTQFCEETPFYTEQGRSRICG